MDRIVELVRQLEPEAPPPPPDIQALQRDALLRSMAPADQAGMHPRHWRARHRGWFVGFAAAAAAAVIAAIVVPRSYPSPRPSAPTFAVLTSVTRALSATGNDVEEVRSSVPGAPVSATSWVDLSTGACRTDTMLGGQPSLTIHLGNGKAVIIDYGLREWWTRNAEGVSCQALTPQTIEDAVSTGHYTVAGRTRVDGQLSLKLVSTSTTTGPHPVAKMTTLWVDATTDLPIQSTSTGHLAERTIFTWLPATATNTAILNVTVPAGFKQVVAPPAGTRSDG